MNEYLDKDGLNRLVSKIKAWDADLLGKISTYNSGSEFLGTYCYAPCDANDDYAYKITGEDGLDWGYWKVVPLNQYHSVGKMPIIIRNIELTPETNVNSPSSSKYNSNNSDWVDKYTINNRFLSKPVKIKTATKVTSKYIKVEMQVDAGTHIYTPDHVLTSYQDKGHNHMQIVSDSTGGFFTNTWDSGTYIAHNKKNAFKESTMWRFATWYTFPNGHHNKDVISQYMKCSWDTPNILSGNSSYSLGGKMFPMGDCGAMPIYTVYKDNNGRYTFKTFRDELQAVSGSYIVDSAPDCEDYKGIMIINTISAGKISGKLYTGKGTHNVVVGSDNKSLYIDDNPIEEMYIEKYEDWYEKSKYTANNTGTKDNSLPGGESEISFTQHRGSSSPHNIKFSWNTKDDKGNTVTHSKIINSRPTFMFTNEMGISANDRYWRIYFCDGISETNNISTGYLTVKTYNNNNIEEYVTIGKVYIKYKPHNGYKKSEYIEYLNISKCTDLNNSPTIRQYLESNKCIVGPASNPIKEIYIKELKTGEITGKLINSESDFNKTTNVSLKDNILNASTGPYVDFRIERVDSGKRSSTDKIIFYLRYRTDNICYEGHVFTGMTNVENNIYKISGDVNLSGKHYILNYNPTWGDFEQATKLTLKEWGIGDGKVDVTGESSDSSVGTQMYQIKETNEPDKIKNATNLKLKVNYEIYVVFDDECEVPVADVKKVGVGYGTGTSVVILEKAKNLFNSPILYNYLSNIQS